MEELKGYIKQYIYRKEDFVIATFQSEEQGEIKIQGSILGVEEKENLMIQGEWESHPKYGKQFKIIKWMRPIPKTKNQIISFLSSKLIKGCGAKRAGIIANALGEDALKIISEQGISSLLSIKGIGKKNAISIVDSVRSTYEIQNIVIELQPYGISANIAIKAYKEFGSNTVKFIKENPYILTKLSLIGFLKADDIARKIGISRLSPFRVQSCTDYVLKEKCFSLGHCYLDENTLIQETLKVLNHNVEDKWVLSEQEVLSSIAILEEHRRLINEQGNIYPKFLYDHEVRLGLNIARHLSIHNQENILSPQKVEQAIKDYQLTEKKVLAEGQREAIRQLMNHRLLILTGGPGTGKTTVINSMVKIYQSLFQKAEIGLAAPTGRASRKLAESTGLEATTIHRTLGFRTGDEPEFNKENPLPFKLIIVDEFSMTDVQLADYLFEAISPSTKVLLVGDTDQLPSVNAGNVLKDMLDAGVPHVRLTEIFRQAQNSQIIINAHAINKGQNIKINHEKGDFYFIKKEDKQGISDMIEKSVKRFIELGHSFKDILVLSPMKKGIIGTNELNKRLQESLNPSKPYKGEINIGETTFREGDKVIQTKNNLQKNVFNGDIGIIKKIDNYIDENGNTSSDKALYCDFHGQEVIYPREDLNQLQLAYSVSIHKSQGGQSPIVIIPVSTAHFIMLSRNLIYTGITRAEEKVVLVGTDKALEMAINNNKLVIRNTMLKVKIKAAIKDLSKYKQDIAL
ncbi:MAG: ATP-dependent RecD-like DNA helicase [Bacillota bacterium]|nr:ATP-dependent RecD-like DNA helicase [Bacillota bacterium]